MVQRDDITWCPRICDPAPGGECYVRNARIMSNASNIGCKAFNALCPVATMMYTREWDESVSQLIASTRVWPWETIKIKRLQTYDECDNVSLNQWSVQCIERSTQLAWLPYEQAFESDQCGWSPPVIWAVERHYLRPMDGVPKELGMAFEDEYGMVQFRQGKRSGFEGAWYSTVKFNLVDL